MGKEIYFRCITRYLLMWKDLYSLSYKYRSINLKDVVWIHFIKNSRTISNAWLGLMSTWHRPGHRALRHIGMMWRFLCCNLVSYFYTPICIKHMLMLFYKAFPHRGFRENCFVTVSCLFTQSLILRTLLKLFSP